MKIYIIGTISRDDTMIRNNNKYACYRCDLDEGGGNLML